MTMTHSEFAIMAKNVVKGLEFDKKSEYFYAFWNMDHFKNSSNNKNSMVITFELTDDGAYFRAIARYLYNLKDCPHKAAVLEATLIIAYQTKGVGYEFDPTDGELRVTIEFPIDDAKIQPKQLEKICGAISGVVDNYDSVIRNAMLTGKIDFSLEDKPMPDASKDEMNALLEKIGGLEGLKKLANASTIESKK
jgi:hypothetical protein